MPEHTLLPGTLGILANTSKPRGSVPPRDHAPVAYEETARLMESALRQAVQDPAMLGRIGAALGRMGRDAGG